MDVIRRFARLKLSGCHPDSASNVSCWDLCPAKQADPNTGRSRQGRPRGFLQARLTPQRSVKHKYDPSQYADRLLLCILTPWQQDTVHSDLPLAFPVGSAGKLKLDPKHQRTGPPDPKPPWTDTMRLDLRLELSR
jgi:hypothetical protein